MRVQHQASQRFLLSRLWLIGAVAVRAISAVTQGSSDHTVYAARSLAAADTLRLDEVERGLAQRLHDMRERREERARQQEPWRDYRPPVPPKPTEPFEDPAVGGDFGTDPFGGVQ